MSEFAQVMQDMRKVFAIWSGILLLLAAVTGCTPTAPIVLPPPSAPVVEPTTFPAQVTVHDGERNRVPDLFAMLSIDADPPMDPITCDYAGDTIRIVCPSPRLAYGWQAHLHLQAPGFDPRDFLIPHLEVELGEVVLERKPAHVDPGTFSVEQIEHVRGAMWTARLNVPFGPRPNQDSNINAFVFYDLYDAPTRARMIDSYKAHGYTHTVTGPVTGNDCYHHLYPCRRGVPTQEQWDAYLDSLQEQWDAGLIPCYFAKPDGIEPGAPIMDQLDALYRQPRAQQLLRCVVYPGWEPSGDKYGWNNATYVYWVKRGADVFPNAVRWLHLVSDLDAPTGQDDDVKLPGGNATAWKNVAPYIHGWFDQVGGYVGGDSDVPSPEFLSELTKHVDRVRRGFKEGYAGWPTSSARGPGTPLLHVLAEYAAFRDFWQNAPEKYAIQIGDAAMAAGADGCLDGCTVP